MTGFARNVDNQSECCRREDIRAVRFVIAIEFRARRCVVTGDTFDVLLTGEDDDITALWTR